MFACSIVWGRHVPACVCVWCSIEWNHTIHGLSVVHGNGRHIVIAVGHSIWQIHDESTHWYLSRRVDDWSILVWCHMPLAPLQCELQRNVLRVYVLTINRNTITCSPGWRHRTPLRVKWIYLKCQTCFLQMQNLSIHELIWASPLFCLYVQAKLNWKISRYVEMR